MSEIKEEDDPTPSLSDDGGIGRARRDESRELDQIPSDEVKPWLDATLRLSRPEVRQFYSEFPIRAVLEEAGEFIRRTGVAGQYDVEEKIEPRKNLADCQDLAEQTLWQAFRLAILSKISGDRVGTLEKIISEFSPTIYTHDGRLSDQAEVTPEMLAEIRAKMRDQVLVAQCKSLEADALDAALALFDRYEDRLAANAAKRALIEEQVSAWTPLEGETKSSLLGVSWIRDRLFRGTDEAAEIPKVRESFDTKWLGPKSYRELIEESKARDSRPKKLSGKLDGVEAYGLNRSQVRMLAKVMDRIYADQSLRERLQSIRVAPSLGRFLGQGAELGEEIHAFSINDEGCLLLSHGAFNDIDTLLGVMREVGFFEIGRAREEHLARNRTMLAKKRLDDQGLLSIVNPVGLEEAEQEPIERMRVGKLRFPVLGRDTPFAGSVYVGGKQRAALLLDKSAHMMHIADTFWVNEIPHLTNDPLATAERLLDYVKDVMPYDSNIEGRIAAFYFDWKIIDISSPIPFETLFLLPRDPDRVNFANAHRFQYPTRPGGVCSHQGALAGFILERGKELGVIGGHISFERGATRSSAHAYALWEPNPRRPIIIDPAQNHPGSPRGGMWPYMRKSHVQLIRENPVPL